MAHYQRVVVRVTKTTEHVAFGVLVNDEHVFVTSDAKEAALRQIEEPLEGRFLRGAIGPNKDEERRETTPWVFFFFNEEADEEQFNASTPPTIKNETLENGVEVVDPDDLDDVVDDLATTIEANISGPNTNELKKLITSELIDEGVDPTTANFSKMVATRLKEAEKERHDKARMFVSQILSKGVIPNLIRQETQRLIELGPEEYWRNGNHPQNIMTDIAECELISEPTEEAVPA